jgi:hypothetical protein
MAAPCGGRSNGSLTSGVRHDLPRVWSRGVGPGRSLPCVRPRFRHGSGCGASRLGGGPVHRCAVRGAGSGPGDAGPTLDARAREAYKRRVRDLEEELDEAEGFNDSERAARLHTEIEFLRGELAAAYGLAGRGRRRAGSEEQARKNVTNCIRSSLTRIERALPALGRHLMTAVKTGTFCSYRPERPTPWEL